MASVSMILHHLRHAVRLLWRNPVTSSLAILALASGISLTVTTFSVVDGLLLSTLPFEHGERYVFISSLDTKRSVPAFRMALHDYADLRRDNTSFEAFFAFLYRPVNLSDEVDFPEQRDAAFVTDEFFSLMPFELRLGRGFEPEDNAHGAPAVAVIGHDLWQRRFDADPNVLEREIRVDGVLTRIIGVMPPGFRFPVRQEIWLPLGLDPRRYERGQAPTVQVAGRLRPGVSLAEARVELGALASRLAEDYPLTHDGRTVALIPYTELFMWPWLRNSLWILLSMVALGLLIAGANVATLLLARALGRMKELATFTALGAGRGTIIAYVLSESLLLTSLGSLAGLLLAAFGVAAVARQMSWLPMPFWMEITLNGRILAFSVAVTAAAGVLAGIYPAWRASRADVTSWLHGARSANQPRADRFVRALVIGKVAFAFLLLVCTGLFLRSTRNLDQLDLGVDSEKVLTAHLTLAPADYPNAQDRIALIDRLVASLRSAPGVAQVAAATSLPVMGYNPRVAYAVEGEAYSEAAAFPEAHRIVITPGFFDLFQLAVFHGRPLLASDGMEGRKVVVVNRSFAARAWPGEEAVGKRLHWEVKRDESQSPGWWHVVGVVADLWPGTLDGSDAAAIYLAQAQAGESRMAILALAQTDAESLTDLLREKVHALDRGLPLYNVQTLEQGVESEMFHTRMFARATTALGLVALLLAAVGIYGVNVFLVRQRIPEIGVRMAMGATRREILGLILGQGLWRIGFGLVLGVVLSAFVTPLLSWLFFGVDSRDPTTFVLTALFLTAVAVLACLVPALRASKISPLEALHHE